MADVELVHLEEEAVDANNQSHRETDDSEEEDEEELLQGLTLHPIPYKLPEETANMTLEEKLLDLYRVVAFVKAHTNMTDKAADKLYKVILFYQQNNKEVAIMSHIPSLLGTVLAFLQHLRSATSQHAGMVIQEKHQACCDGGYPENHLCNTRPRCQPGSA